MNTMTINGVRIETNKGVSIVGDRLIMFSDGSTYDLVTRILKNIGPGFVRVNGVEVGADASTAQSEDHFVEDKVTRTFSTASRLDLTCSSDDVRIETGTRPGIEVEIVGTSDFIESVETIMTDDTLHVSTPSSTDSVNISGVMITSSFSGRFSSIMGGTATSAKIVIRVPSRTPIAVKSSGFSDVAIRNVSGPLTVNLRGSGDVVASDASGDVIIDLKGSGDVKIDHGEVDHLEVKLKGSGDVKFGGTATDATLDLMGSGDIKVSRVINRPDTSKRGSGDIRVKSIG